MPKTPQGNARLQVLRLATATVLALSGCASASPREQGRLVSTGGAVSTDGFGGSGGSAGIGTTGGAGTVTYSGAAPGGLGSQVLPRLTNAQYRNVLTDLFGEGVVIPEVERDTRPYLFSVIGAATTALSEHGVDLYDQSAHAVAASVFADANRRVKLVPCEVTPPLDAACLDRFIEDFGKRAWRRPLGTTEIDRYRALANSIGLGDPWVTLQYVTAALLESPNFIYRVQVGEPDSGKPNRGKFTGYEMASRLSFFLRNTQPDAELLLAAENGGLATLEGISLQTNRLLADSLATRAMMAQFFGEYLDLPLLTNVSFPEGIGVQGDMAGSMTSEVLAMVNRIALDESGDMRTLFNTPTTLIDSNLAKLYGLPMPAKALELVQLPTLGPRAGILTTGALLTLNNRPNRTSPTIRGLFIRQRFLCGAVPPPPPNIPPIVEEDEGVGATIREKVAAHSANPACAGCHKVMDPLGLGMEDFDQYGRHRTHYGSQPGALPVDSSGDVDGLPFNGARALGAILATDNRVTDCMVKQLFRYASSHLETAAEAPAITDLSQIFAQQNYQFKPLLLALVTSDAFRYTQVEAP